MTTDPLIGDALGDYMPLRVLGEGGMGVVYAADDLALHRKVALKVLNPSLAEDTKARDRFQLEIGYAVAIEHPNVVPVYAAGYERPHFFIAMRLVDGPDLHKVLRDGPLPEARALRILGQVGSALATVHAKGLVHRDVKPHNVLLWSAGSEDEHAMLTDFGIAKAVDDTRGLTGMALVGTPGYMAPEVCLGRPATAASDQYSLACTAFEMLAGRLPYDGTGVELKEAAAEQTPLRLEDVSNGISRDVCDVIAKGLEKEPRHRFASVRDFVKALKGAQPAFTQSEALTRIMASTAATGRVVGEMVETGLSDTGISVVTGIDPTSVARMRRKQARRALVGRRQ